MSSPAQTVTFKGSSPSLASGTCANTTKVNATTFSVAPSNKGINACGLSATTSTSGEYIDVGIGMQLTVGAKAQFTADEQNRKLTADSTNTGVMTVGSGTVSSNGNEVTFTLTPVGPGSATLEIYDPGAVNGSPDYYDVPITVVPGSASPTPAPTASPTVAPSATPTVAPTAAPTAAPTVATECVANSSVSLTSAGLNEEVFLNGGSASALVCSGLAPSAPSQILFAGNSIATTAYFNIWNGAPHGIVVPSSAVASPNVLFALELTANPTATFTTSPDALFGLALTFASALPSGTYYVGYCLENGTQTGCVNGTTFVDQPAYVAATQLGTNGLTSGTVQLSTSAPYLVELYH